MTEQTHHEHGEHEIAFAPAATLDKSWISLRTQTLTISGMLPNALLVDLARSITEDLAPHLSAGGMFIGAHSMHTARTLATAAAELSDRDLQHLRGLLADIITARNATDKGAK